MDPMGIDDCFSSTKGDDTRMESCTLVSTVTSGGSGVFSVNAWFAQHLGGLVFSYHRHQDCFKSYQMAFLQNK